MKKIIQNSFAHNLKMAVATLCNKIKKPFPRMQSIAVVTLCVSFIATFGCGKPNNGEQKYEVYENHDVSACGINDPLHNIEWLREYCESLDKQYFLSINIDLYKVIDTDEHIFQIGLTFPIENDPIQGPTGYTKNWRDCTGKIILGVQYPGVPMSPKIQERFDEFIKNIEYVAELFHFVKQ